MAMSDETNKPVIGYRKISYDDYLRGVAPLRSFTEENWIEAPIHDNPWSIFQYHGDELFTKVVKIPVGAFLDDKPVGYTSIYNISDTTLRFGGIYIEPEHRGNHLGVGMCDYAVSLWPSQWDRLVGYYRSDTFIRFTKSWKMREFPEHYWRVYRTTDGSRMDHKVILTVRDRF